MQLAFWKRRNLIDKDMRSRKKGDANAITKMARASFADVPGLYPLTESEAQEDIEFFRSAVTFESIESKLKRKKTDAFETKLYSDEQITQICD